MINVVTHPYFQPQARLSILTQSIGNALREDKEAVYKLYPAQYRMHEEAEANSFTLYYRPNYPWHAAQPAAAKP